MDEEEKIRDRYLRRKSDDRYSLSGKFAYYNTCLINEREEKYEAIFKQSFANIRTLRILEIGAGGGSNLGFFHRLGITWANIFANELLDDRMNVLEKKYPNVHTLPGNAIGIDESLKKFDVVFQSTVFTSILDHAFKQSLADKMWNMTRQGGIILWYDFKFNNPRNKDVKGVGKKGIRELFNKSNEINFYPVTLVPPIGRRIGRIYPVINKMFPFLRSHLIAVIHK